MARLQSSEVLYEAAEKFRENCLLGKRSFLWPDKTPWTTEVLEDIRRRMVEAEILDRKKSFMEKLAIQTEGASPEVFMVLADIFYIYSLPAINIYFPTKKGWIQTIADLGRLILPNEDDPIWDALSKGVINIGIKYNHKYEQIVLFTLFAKYFKQENGLAWGHKNIRQILDKANKEVSDISITASDMRGILLHLFFPEYYEDIISGRDKLKILKTYQSQLVGAVPADIDDAIYEIRKVLSAEYDRDGQPFRFYRDLQHQWKAAGSKPTGGDSPTPSPKNPGGTEVISDYSHILTVMKYTKNVIFYGPPGTGKTYTAQKVAKALIAANNTDHSSPVLDAQFIIENLPMYDVLALTLYNKDKEVHLSVPEIFDNVFIKARFSIRPISAQKQVIWGTLQSHTDPASPNVHVTKSQQPYIFDKDGDSKWKLTQSGKKYVQENLGHQIELIKANKNNGKLDLNKYIFVSTFHQSYSYEEFIEGLRPKTSEDDPGVVVYEVEPGIFRKICSLAKEDSKPYVLIIDEINRGNISKIFGELITLIEDDKRVGGKNPLSVKLPYSGDDFSVPDNLYIIGTMNTSDRSIALLDVALRRRFAFVEMNPQHSLLETIVIQGDGAQVNLGSLLRHLNKKISADIDTNHQIGHSYFLELMDIPVDGRVDVLEYIWNYKIIPLLEEYYYNQNEKLAELLSSFEGDEALLPSYEKDIVYARDNFRQSGEDLVFAMQKMLEQ